MKRSKYEIIRDKKKIYEIMSKELKDMKDEELIEYLKMKYTK